MDPCVCNYMGGYETMHKVIWKNIATQSDVAVLVLLDLQMVWCDMGEYLGNERIYW